MTKTVQSKACEDNPEAVRIAEVLHDLVKESKAYWVAHVIGMSPTVLSECRKGTRNLPLFRAAQIDHVLKTHILLEELAAMEGCGVYTLDPSPMSADDLERLFPVILREQGATNAEVFESLADGTLDDAERARLHAHFIKLRRYFTEAEERTAPIQPLRQAQ